MGPGVPHPIASVVPLLFCSAASRSHRKAPALLSSGEGPSHCSRESFFRPWAYLHCLRKPPFRRSWSPARLRARLDLFFWRHCAEGISRVAVCHRVQGLLQFTRAFALLDPFCFEVLCAVYIGGGSRFGVPSPPSPSK